MKHDIKERADIELLVSNFYSKVKTDQTIGVVFNEVAHVNWDNHISALSDFWESVLFGVDHYHKNAMKPHIEIYKKFPLEQVHFDRWLELFFQTVDECFEGVVANTAKSRAQGIAGMMLLKMDRVKYNY